MSASAEQIIRDVQVLAHLKRWSEIQPFLDLVVNDSDTSDQVLLACWPAVSPRNEHEREIFREAYARGEVGQALSRK